MSQKQSDDDKYIDWDELEDLCTLPPVDNMGLVNDEIEDIKNTCDNGAWTIDFNKNHFEHLDLMNAYQAIKTFIVDESCVSLENKMLLAGPCLSALKKLGVMWAKADAQVNKTTATESMNKLLQSEKYLKGLNLNYLQAVR